MYLWTGRQWSEVVIAPIHTRISWYVLSERKVTGHIGSPEERECAPIGFLITPICLLNCTFQANHHIFIKPRELTNAFSSRQMLFSPHANHSLRNVMRVVGSYVTCSLGALVRPVNGSCYLQSHLICLIYQLVA